ncbi:helicase with zinc finger domain 2 [Brienomyrus brachyistius]|uniref:helicase with zinc finger domain 2 n=1 Tax=Brienomyrus brachyistius TaxID=42636 RepID=UPI0020B301E7|nr:helicase with zinc finger domain 2 [Brienomyrus brachyistius]
MARQGPIQATVSRTVNLHVACFCCCKAENEITFSVIWQDHPQCAGNILLARWEGSHEKLRPVKCPPAFPKPQKYFPCWYFVEGCGCTLHGIRCTYARSSEEAAVWNFLKEQHLDYSQLIGLVKRVQNKSPGHPPNQPVQPLVSSPQFHCQVCKKWFSSGERFMEHCSTPEHERMIFTDATVEWKHRDPPENVNQPYKICERPSTCVYGDNCTSAHSLEELMEWHMRDKNARKRKMKAAEEGLLSYQERLLQEYRESLSEVLIMSESVPGVTVHCDRDLSAAGHLKDLPLKWTFKIISEMPLAHVALMKKESGATFSFTCNSPEGPCTYATGGRFWTWDKSFEIPVYFTLSSTSTFSPGVYDQWLVFDFDQRPVLLQKLQVRVGDQMLPLPEEMPTGVRPLPQDLERWHRGNRFIIPCIVKTEEEEEELLREYKPPHMNLQFNPKAEDRSSLTRQNYRERMHNFLYREELALEEVVSRLSLQKNISLTKGISGPAFGMKFAPDMELFAKVPVHFSLTPDTPEGYVLRRSVCSALVAPASAANQNNQVYEADIVRDASSENMMCLQLSKRCCHDMGLQNNMTCDMEVQFQISRLPLCEMHEAVDLLPEVEMVLPDMSQCCVPVHAVEYPRLNAKQQAAMSFILGESDGKRSVAPLLIYGPFGTGKTYTLATVAKELVRQPGTRVLICTHTNSSADLYVKDHFHLYVNAGNPQARPLRVKTNKKGVGTSATDAITVQYCHLSTDGQFQFPDKATVDKFKIVITTAAMARLFHGLKLPLGYFSHILIDEASQMLECEALMPLSLAGKGTRVVLAGDHMQMGPRLFSLEEGQHHSHILLNRLFHHYKALKEHNVALSSRIIFNENYRSTKEIVDFVSTHFYVGKSDVIKASGAVPPHPWHHPLRFQHVHGQCHLDSTTMSWLNPQEAEIVVQVVKQLVEEWPPQWGNRERRAICVLSEGCQITFIRQELRKRQLGDVTVERFENVQGKQFRVVVMTTVHTRDSLLSSDSAYLDFFNDARVLNTAMTRAQSQVIVVGDAVALCMFGRCSKIWKSYIGQCIGKESMQPPHLTVDDIENDVKVNVKFFKETEEDTRDTDSITSEISDTEDPILKELLESKDVRITVTADGILDICPSQKLGESSESPECDQQPILSSAAPESMCHLLTNPHRFKRCVLIMERFHLSYARPLDDPTLCIQIKGRKNIGHSFHRDHVVVELLNDDRCFPEGRVLDVLQTEETSRLHVCTMDRYDHQLMVPINNAVSKIFTPLYKDKPNYVAVRTPDNDYRKPVEFVKINEVLRRESLFVVKVLKWQRTFKYPLGVVVKVLPKVTSLEAGLEVLDTEYQLNRTLSLSVQEEINCMDINEGGENRKDFRKYTTFTIDPEDSQDMDDAISVRDLGQRYEIGVHIADVASFVTMGSATDKYAQKLGVTFYCPGKEPEHMFPKCLSTKNFSLLPNCERRAISLMTEVEKNTDRIVSSQFHLSVICSDRKLSYEDAETIIQSNSNKNLSCDTLEGCVAKACHFSEVLRKERKLADWCYKSPDEEIHMGNISHRMVEELMVLFNSSVADWLLSIEKTKSLTPLRCQDKPNPVEVSHFKEKQRSLIPMSLHLSYHTNESGRADNSQNTVDTKIMSHHTLITQEDKASMEPTTAQHSPLQASSNFCILSSWLEDLESAAHEGDIHRVIDIITTDNIHPQLLPVVTEFIHLLSKAQVLRSNSSAQSRVGHYDMQLDSYTWASSPIRRYVDVIVQRLLHAAVEDTNIKYTPTQIDWLSTDFSQKHVEQRDYEKKAQLLNTASQLSTQSLRKICFVVQVPQNSKMFYLRFPLNNTSLPKQITIMYKDIQLIAQPEFDEESECMVLNWMRRIYSFNNNQSPFCSGHHTATETTSILADTWKEILSSIKAEEWENVLQLTKEIRSSIVKDDSMQPERLTSDDHYTDVSLKLKAGKTMEVQLGSDTERGLLVPVVQLLVVHPGFEICLEHAKNAVQCFSQYALQSTKKHYNTYMDYQKIWKPLCEMESASSAVAENDSIIFDDIVITFKKDSKCKNLVGFFRLSLETIKQWSIECDLKHCFLCIRLRNQIQNKNRPEKLSDHVDPMSYTWIAHGITTKITDEDESKRLSYVQVNFCVNHLPFKNNPEGIFRKDTRFTLELIPKLLPDVRKEVAIYQLAQANLLVQNIAVGRETCFQSVSKRWKSQMTKKRLEDFPALNNSQNKAIQEALENQFTLIQGPPGTGKTVVGVYLVYWFFMSNEKKTEEESAYRLEDMKKSCILYCGPSNKSVDVVAKQLLKIQRVLRPLRVYSEQMEMLEFPYPGSNLKLSRKAQREGRPSNDLTSITLHHKIRRSGNPFSAQIREFDDRIKRKEEITDVEVERYKELLNKARQFELENHDVILCTCTAASNPNFTKKLAVHQIIIDECAMATEPEALIPLTVHKPKQIVLLGDHKQLRPILQNDLTKKLGMEKSLFERYVDNALMLDTQYRMQRSICEFPSNEFYNGQLVTGIDRKPSMLMIKSRPTAILFGHVEGKEERLIVSTEQGNENSKANSEEADHSVRIASLLIKHSGIQPENIAILTPYNAQVAKINEALCRRNITNVTVTTIVKSQGSEWRYVIMSTVCSCPQSEIETEPTRSWIVQKLGFVMDPNQLNVGITRAQEGLCILGNKNLLRCSSLWRRLLDHYDRHHCVEDNAKDIHVQSKTVKAKKKSYKFSRQMK